MNNFCQHIYVAEKHLLSSNNLGNVQAIQWGITHDDYAID